MNVKQLTSILASEIECDVFEKHVAPALKVAKAVEAGQAVSYVIIKARDEMALSAGVNEWLAKGYVLVGGPFVLYPQSAIGMLGQAVVK